MCCLLCVEIAKGTMTPLEVARAYTEVDVNREHAAELINNIFKYYDSEEVARNIDGMWDEEV